jgi:hypothetical protein
VKWLTWTDPVLGCRATIGWLRCSAAYRQDCISAPKKDPAYKLIQSIEIFRKLAARLGSRSAPIGTPARDDSQRLIQRDAGKSGGVRVRCRFTSLRQSNQAPARGTRKWQLRRNLTDGPWAHDPGSPRAGRDTPHWPRGHHGVSFKMAINPSRRRRAET